MKILMFISIFPPAYSGAAAACVKLASGLARLGVEVEVVCPRAGGASRKERMEDFRVRRLYCGPFSPARPRKPRYINPVFSLRGGRYVRAERKRADIVHFHGVGKVSLPAVAMAWAAGIPMVGKFTHLDHDAPSAHAARKGGWMVLAAMTRMRVLIATSPAIREDAERFFPGPVPRVAAIPNPVDTRAFAPASPEEKAGLRRDLGFPQDVRLFVFAGSFSPRKGSDTLALAWEAVRATLGKKVRLAVLGPVADQASRDRLERAGGAVFPGQVPPEAVARYLKAADGFILPSRGEGLPNAVLEAMACGLPSVAGLLPGITDYLLGGDRGVLVRPEDAVGFADALQRLARDPELGNALGRNARLWTLENASEGAVCRSYYALYQDLLSRRKG